MRRMYQTQWQDISYSLFAKYSSTELPSPAFYDAFYIEFFNRYKNWDQLPENWSSEKQRWAKFVLEWCRSSTKILSVGCGLGVMEHYMRSQAPEIDLSVHEVTSSAWRWIDSDFSENQKYLGLIPACMPDSIQFDLVYLATVDYAMDDDDLISLLVAVRKILNRDGGKCLLISASFQHLPVTLKDKVVDLTSRTRSLIATCLDYTGLYSRGQFWGWMRTQKEYQSLMLRAGYSSIEDGFIDPLSRTGYWISGS